MAAYRVIRATVQESPRQGAQKVFQCPAVDGPDRPSLAPSARAARHMERSVSTYAYWCKKGHFQRLCQGVQQSDMDESDSGFNVL